jgi:hypothetical protein
LATVSTIGEWRLANSLSSLFIRSSLSTPQGFCLKYSSTRPNSSSSLPRLELQKQMMLSRIPKLTVEKCVVCILGLRNTTRVVILKSCHAVSEISVSSLSLVRSGILNLRRTSRWILQCN